MYKFKLFIVKGLVTSDHKVKEIKETLNSLIYEDYEFEVIDVVKESNIALKYNIIATPTLMKFSPEPHIKIVGDMSKKEQLKELLNIKDWGAS